MQPVASPERMWQPSNHAAFLPAACSRAAKALNPISLLCPCGDVTAPHALIDPLSSPCIALHITVSSAVPPKAAMPLLLLPDGWGGASIVLCHTYLAASEPLYISLCATNKLKRATAALLPGPCALQFFALTTVAFLAPHGFVLLLGLRCTGRRMSSSHCILYARTRCLR
jgi:hypothetical protein